MFIVNFIGTRFDLKVLTQMLENYFGKPGHFHTKTNDIDTVEAPQ